MQCSPLATRSMMPHSQMAVTSRPARAASHRARSCGSPYELNRITAHQDPKIALGLGQQSVWIDQLELRSRLQCVHPVHVAVDQHGPLVVMSHLPPASTGKGVIRSPAQNTGDEAPPTSR
jgi:hypothetical protein